MPTAILAFQQRVPLALALDAGPYLSVASLRPKVLPVLQVVNLIDSWKRDVDSELPFASFDECTVQKLGRLARSFAGGLLLVVISAVKVSVSPHAAAGSPDRGSVCYPFLLC
jgi:hypothetical protein